VSGALEKSLAILEYLVVYPGGVGLAQIATDLNQSRSGCHRTLHALIGHGYVRQLPQRGDYALTTRLASMGLGFLGKSGVVDIAQPVIVDGERLTLVAKAQGARSGLLYDPDMGVDLRLSCSAAGQAWLMTLPEDMAIACVTRQGIGEPKHYGPNAPTSIKALLKLLGDHRKRGFSIIQDAYAPGMSSMAAPVKRRDEAATGVLVIAGPSPRLTLKRMVQFGPALLAAAEELAVSGNASPLLKSANVGTWGNIVDKPARRSAR
jgi:DNA-binding IclR family transcriptional regulator